MGANFDYNLIKDAKLEMLDEEIKNKAQLFFESAAYDYGHAGYTGTFAEKLEKGVIIHRDKVFENEQEAMKYVDEVLDSDKWGPADVVPIKDTGWFIGGWCSE